MTKKEQVQLSEFEEFCKLNDKYLHYEKPNVENSAFAMGLNGLKEKAKDYGFSDSFMKEMEDKSQEITDKVKKELEDINKVLEQWLFNLIKRIYVFNEVEKTDEQIKDDTEKVRRFCNDTGAGLNVEFIYLTVKEFFI